MKLDIEGHEYLAVKGATKLFTEYGVDQINFEFNPKYLTHDYKDPQLAEEFLFYLKEKLGVTLYKDFNAGDFYQPLSDDDMKFLSHPANQAWLALDLYGKQASKGK